MPTDFSECANAAAEVAMRLAKQSGAEIHFLHLAVDMGSPSHVPGTPVQAGNGRMGVLRDNLDQLVKAAEADGIRARHDLVMGTGHERVPDYILPKKIDFLVMGSHGATGIREMVIGSKTRYVIRHVKVPTLVVKEMPENEGFGHIVFASSFKKDMTSQLRVVVSFSRLWGSRLHLLFINAQGHPIEGKVARLTMSRQMEGFPNIDYTMNIIETNDKEFGITRFSTGIGADMIAVAMEDKGLLGRLFNPGVAEQLINRSALPVLVVR